MQIKRVFNNNVAMAVTEDGAEIIVIGRGLCFGRHAGDNLDASLVEKTYDLRRPDQDEAAFARMEKLIQSIPTIYLVIAEEIAWMLRESFDPDIDDGIVMALADHISLSLEREKNGVVCENPLLPEIRNFYRKEYALAGNAARIIETYTGICISPQEQGFITLHIVNSTMRQRADRLIVSVELVRDVLSIVSTYYGVALDETSLAYERFLRHLQFFCATCPGPQRRSGDRRRALFVAGSRLSARLWLRHPDIRPPEEFFLGVCDGCREELSGIPHRQPAWGAWTSSITTRRARPSLAHRQGKQKEEA